MFTFDCVNTTTNVVSEWAVRFSHALTPLGFYSEEDLDYGLLASGMRGGGGAMSLGFHFRGASPCLYLCNESTSTIEAVVGHLPWCVSHLVAKVTVVKCTWRNPRLFSTELFQFKEVSRNKSNFFLHHMVMFSKRKGHCNISYTWEGFQLLSWNYYMYCVWRGEGKVSR